MRSVTFLSHVVSDQGVEVDPKKIEKVRNWPIPLTPTDIQSFLGMANYYHMFVEGFPLFWPIYIFNKKEVKV